MFIVEVGGGVLGCIILNGVTNILSNNIKAWSIPVSQYYWIIVAYHRYGIGIYDINYIGSILCIVDIFLTQV